MHRRRVLLTAAAGVFASSLAAAAPPAGKGPRIRLVFANTPAAELAGPRPTSPYLRVFLDGMRGLDWIDGRNISIERVSAEGQVERFAGLIDEAIKRTVDLLMITGPTAAIERAKRARDTLPIVFTGTNNPDDLIRLGLVHSIARPGGSVTGLTTNVAGPEIRDKRLQLLVEAVPGARRVAYLGEPAPLSSHDEALARTFNLTLLPFDVAAPEAFETVFAAVAHSRVGALLVSDAPVFFWGRRRRIIEFAARQRLPAIYYNRVFVEAGGLMSYGTDYVDIYRRAAGYVDKILRGAKPGDLPIAQPTKFELVVNLTTAKALGLTSAQSLLHRADQVIQ